MRGKVWVTLLIGCALFLANGCSKTGMVKNDEGLVSAKANKDNKNVTANNSANSSSTASQNAKNQALNAANQQSQKPGAANGAVGKQSLKSGSAKEGTAQNKLEPIANAAELKIALESVYFDFDSSVLSQDARKKLVNNAEKLSKDGKVRIRIEGNCDERGSDEYNIALGERRAKAAIQYLATLGIPEKRLSSISYGKEKPAVEGHDETAWAKNRRDEFVIVSQ